jgi:2-polyprenyl-3-methyl-5-hydroxy-6-metoxy-1,4-benzoquinol methylase
VPDHNEHLPEFPSLDEDIERHYSQGQEQQRLRRDTGDVERLRTADILHRYLPSPPAVICDVGGAAGIYAFPLAEQGYQVHLIDPVALHIEQAQTHSAQSGIPLASIARGDARALNISSGVADAVLLLGPLYHLVKKPDRMAALDEAKRILKPGGILFAGAISRFASLIDGLSSGSFRDSQFRELVGADLATGEHRNPTSFPEYFTTAYFHRPEELYSEIREATFEDVKLLGVEGPAWGAAHFRSAVTDLIQRKVLLAMLSEIESESSIIGASAHFIAIARKQERGKRKGS